MVKANVMMLFGVFFLNDEGVTSIEYALIASLIAVVIVGAVSGLGQKVLGLFTKVDGGLS